MTPHGLVRHGVLRIPGGTMGMREPGGTWRRGTSIASRPSGWPALRTPRWMLAAGVVLVAGLALAAIPHRPSTAQRATDLRGMVHDLTTDIESCAGGVSDSITALRAIQSGASSDVKTAATIASTAAANCSPANRDRKSTRLNSSHLVISYA